MNEHIIGRCETSYLYSLIGKNIKVHFTNGNTLEGELKQIDKDTLIIKPEDGKYDLAFKHHITKVESTDLNYKDVVKNIMKYGNKNNNYTKENHKENSKEPSQTEPQIKIKKKLTLEKKFT